MSRSSWHGLGRPAGRHAAGPRGPVAPAPPPAAPPAVPPEAARPAPSPGARFFGAPTVADAPLVSPVTDAARAATASVPIPAYISRDTAPLVTIDALGRKCPIPIIMLAQQIADVPVGAVIAVLADDPAAYSDVPAWCGLKSHDCVFRADYETGWSFGIRRRY